MHPVVPEVGQPPVGEKTDDSSSKTVGIIYPPPEVRNIVDKTASFVARNGPEFETRIRQNEINNPKFNFLNPNDPYHAYYQYKVKDFQEGKAAEPSAKTPMGLGFGVSKPIQDLKNIEPVVPSEPPPEFEYIADPPSISAFDLDVVKLTAQFVARNGRQFLTNLMNREQRNFQFDFLRPQHSLFQYFTKLVEHYTKILIPPKDLPPKLKVEGEDPKEVLKNVKHRVEWHRYQEREKRKEEEALERERVAYAQIDWHDFVVVETVDFQPSETGNLPPPTTPEEVGARIIAQERVGDENDVEMEVESGDEDGDDDKTDEEIVNEVEGPDSDDEKERPPQPPPPPPPPPPSDSSQKATSVADIPQPPPLPPAPDKVVIRDYNPKAPKVIPTTTSGQFLVSPITGERIPAEKMQEHMRIGLLDPKWMEQQRASQSEKQQQEEVYAPGTSISDHLKKLSKRRTDIFGLGVEETQIGKLIGEEEKKVEKVIWDGHTASMEKVSQKARENISIEDQIALIHKVKGLVPDEEKEKIGPALPKGGASSDEPKSEHKMINPPAKLITTTVVSTRAEPAIPAAVPPAPVPLSMSVQPAPPMMQRPAPIPQPQRVMVMPPMRPPMMGMPHMAGPPTIPSFMAPMPGPPIGGHVAPPMDDEPPAKKAKTEESLIPEHEFLRRYKGQVSFKVAIPNMPDKPEFKLNGQTLTFTLPYTDNVSVIKAKLHEELGMAAGKQKLQYDGLFIKDSNTLAYYNFLPGAIIQLALKERGGRKK